jgi:hypothetical protein
MTWKDGMFAMKDAYIVRVLEPKDGRCGIGYLQDYGGEKVDITKPYNGGGQCWSVGFDELRPITEPVTVLRVLMTAAHEDVTKLTTALAEATERRDKLRYALGLIKQAQAQEPSPLAGEEHVK